MPSISALASHPHRTSPVLRGVWILDSILGTPPPRPTARRPGVGTNRARASLSVRSANGSWPTAIAQAAQAATSALIRLDSLWKTTTCLGRWRDQDAGTPIDAGGKLPDGTRLDGPDSLKAALLERKRLFLRNLAKRLLGYALGRGLTPSDTCAVETVVTRGRAPRLLSLGAAARDCAQRALPPHCVSEAGPGVTMPASRAVQISRRALLRGSGVVLGAAVARSHGVWKQAHRPPPKPSPHRRTVHAQRCVSGHLDAYGGRSRLRTHPEPGAAGRHPATSHGAEQPVERTGQGTGTDTTSRNPRS